MNRWVGTDALHRADEWLRQSPAWVRLAAALGAVGLGALAWRLRETSVGLVPLAVVTIVSALAIGGEWWKQWAKRHRAVDYLLSATCIVFVASMWVAEGHRPGARTETMTALLCAIAFVAAWRRWVRR